MGSHHIRKALGCARDIALADGSVASGGHRRSAGSWVTETLMHPRKGVHGFAWSYPRRSFVIMANLARMFGKTLGLPEAINVVWKYALHTIVLFNHNRG